MSILRKITLPLRPLVRSAGFDIVRFPSARQRQEEQARYWLSTLKIGTCIDVGANEGQFANIVRGMWPEAAIFSFEPVGATYNSLQSNTRQMKNIHTFHCALGEADGEISMNRNNFSPSSSILPMRDELKQMFPFVADTEVEKVAIRRLDDVLKDFTLQDEIFLKADVQGYELHVLKGAPKTLARCNVVMLETSFRPLYDGQPKFHNVYSFMRDRGFAFSGVFDQLATPTDGSIIEADALFIREDRTKP